MFRSGMRQMLLCLRRRRMAVALVVLVDISMETQQQQQQQEEEEEQATEEGKAAVHRETGVQFQCGYEKLLQLHRQGR